MYRYMHAQSVSRFPRKACASFPVYARPLTRSINICAGPKPKGQETRDAVPLIAGDAVASLCWRRDFFLSIAVRTSVSSAAD